MRRRNVSKSLKSWKNQRPRKQPIVRLSNRILSRRMYKPPEFFETLSCALFRILLRNKSMVINGIGHIKLAYSFGDDEMVTALIITNIVGNGHNKLKTGMLRISPEEK